MAGHSIENTGTDDLIYLEMFSTGEFEEFSLNQWLRALPPQVAMAHTNLSGDELSRIPAKATALVG